MESRNGEQQVDRASPDDSASSRVGSVIKGKWRVESLIGSGGMAAVYAATHRNGQRVALKVLHVGLAQDDSIRDRFLREGYVANAVNHPACVAVLDDDMTEDGAPFLVMELLEGETLRDLWKRLGKRMPIPAALHVADAVLDCLAACHAAGVIHRDLKPPNIFITNDKHVKVLDFGVAQLRDASTERTREGTALGTPHYMSPEQAMGLVDKLDGRADLFSVGAILHALITGQRIHTARTENEALILAATTPVPSVARIAPDLPLPVITLIDKSLAWDRRNRYADAREMQAATREALAFVTGAAKAPAPSQPHSQAQPASQAQPHAQPSGPRSGQARAAQAGPTRSASQPQAPQAPQVSAAVQEQLAEDHPRVSALRDLFKHVERLLPTVRQLGWAHPATDRSLRTAFEAFAEALGNDPDALSWAVRPYSFLHGGQTIWEPQHPFDVVPYNLFAAGLRTMQIQRGITLDEFRSLLNLLLLDPGKDLPPEDDIVTALWDLGAAHVVYETADTLAEGDADQRERFFNEADQLERAAADASHSAADVEARAMAVYTDGNALSSGRVQTPMAIDDAIRLTLSSQMVLTKQQWSERYVDVLVEGYLDADTKGDAEIVLSSLRRSASDLVVAGQSKVALDLFEAIATRVSQRGAATVVGRLLEALTDAMFGGDTFKLVLDHLQAEADDIDRFAPVLNRLSGKELPAVLAMLQAPLSEKLRGGLIRYAERVLPGHEQELASTITGLDPLVVGPMLGLLKSIKTAEGRKVLTELANSKDVAVRIEAKILLADTPESMQDELGRLCADKSLGVRIAALRAIARHGLKRAVPIVARQIQTASFHTLVPEERFELLATMMAVAPERGEELALDIAKRGGLLTNESREVSRVAAIDALASHSRSREVIAALRDISQARWGTSEETRNKAYSAAVQIEARLSSPASPQEAAR